MLISLPLNQFAYNRAKSNEQAEMERAALAELAADKDKAALEELLTEYEVKNAALTDKLHSDLNGWEKQNISDDIEFNNSMIKDIERCIADLDTNN